MTRRVRLYPHPSAEGRVGIPVDGELFDEEDAERLIGQGIARRSPPKAKRHKPVEPDKEA